MPTQNSHKSEPVEVVAVMRMRDGNFHYLRPIVMSDFVKHLWIVRPLPPPQHLEIENSTYIRVAGATIFTRMWRIYREAARLGRRTEVGAYVSFNPVPYGLIALIAGMRAGKPVHLAFVGHDWYWHCRRWYGIALNWLLRKARLITVTGPGMKAEMVQKGYDAKRIHLLPHAIDVSKYNPKPSPTRNYDCIFVGALIHRKRVDLILHAIAILRNEFPQIKLCIVGDGPRRAYLEGLTKRYQLEDNVLFVGYQADPAPWFCDAKTVVISSEMEGYPFVLVEGLCAGTVPVSTAVGSIPDFIEDGKTGFLVPRGDSAGLAKRIGRVLRDEQILQDISQRLLTRRDTFTYEKVSELWTSWFNTMLDSPEPVQPRFRQIPKN